LALYHQSLMQALMNTFPEMDFKYSVPGTKQSSIA